MTGIFFAALFIAGTAIAGSYVMTNETVVFCSDLEPRTARTLFAPGKVLRVERASGSQAFEEGTDYTVDPDGTLSLTPGSSIPVLDYYASGKDETCYRFQDLAGRWFYSPSGNDKRDSYDLYVTYTCTNLLNELYAGAWESKLTTVLTKMNAKEPVRITFFGDSITAGHQASSLNTSAYAPLMIAGLKEHFGYTEIRYANKAVAGKTTAWGVQEIQQVVDTDPDLVVLAFGMNDGTANFKENTESMILALREENPDVSDLPPVMDPVSKLVFGRSQLSDPPAIGRYWRV